MIPKSASTRAAEHDTSTEACGRYILSLDRGDRIGAVVVRISTLADGTPAPPSRLKQWGNSGTEPEWAKAICTAVIPCFYGARSDSACLRWAPGSWWRSEAWHDLTVFENRYTG